MATHTIEKIPVASGASTTFDISATLATVTASAEIVMSKNALFVINATTDICIITGNAGVKTPTAANYRIPANVPMTLDLGDNADRIRLFNLTGGSSIYYIMMLCRN